MEQNENGPNYVGYYKHLLQELYSQMELDSATTEVGCSKGKVEELYNNLKAGKFSSYSDCVSYFQDGICEGLSEFEKEKLRSILNQSVVFLSQEADEILSQILAKFQIEADLRGEVILPSYSSSSEEDTSFPRFPHRRKRKKSSSPITNYFDCEVDLKSPTFSKVCKDIQSLQGNGEICHKAVDAYSKTLLEKLGKMEKDLEEFLNIIVSKGRQMTSAEKQQLGRQIQKLPDKALDRVVEIVNPQNFPGRQVSDNIHVNLDEQDNVTLWRLYYHVKTVVEANKF